MLKFLPLQLIVQYHREFLSTINCFDKDLFFNLYLSLISYFLEFLYRIKFHESTSYCVSKILTFSLLVILLIILLFGLRFLTICEQHSLCLFLTILFLQLLRQLVALLKKISIGSTTLFKQLKLFWIRMYFNSYCSILYILFFHNILL